MLILSSVSSKVFTFHKKEKLVASTTSLLLIQRSSDWRFRDNSILTSSSNSRMKQGVLK